MEDKEDQSEHLTNGAVPLESEKMQLNEFTVELNDQTPKPPRETWAKKVDFLFACVGFSVGLGNVWRFPYLCYKNGGGAFLIPYVIFVATVGLPLFLLEVAIGQYTRRGCIAAWNMCPLLQGVGVGMAITNFLVHTYYIVIIAWTLFYLFASFQSTLPWSHCNNTWNTEKCQERVGYSINDSFGNLTDMESMNYSKISHPGTEYWQNRVLRISDGIEDIGIVNWDLALCLLLAWIIVYLCIFKGIKGSGKVMYFTAPAPYFFMLALLIRGFTLPGSIEGVKYYLYPDISRLADIQVWVDAGTQIFFSFSIANGCLTALGSYNKYEQNCYRDCIVFTFLNALTSLLAGLVIFTVLGFMAHEQGVDISQVAESGPGLGFIVYPVALSHMPFPPLWSVLFFCMILFLGLDSEFVGVEGYITAISDLAPNHLRQGYKKQLFLIGACILSGLIGLSMVAEGGLYVFLLFDYYASSRILLITALVETIAIAYVYGVHRFHSDLQSMLGFKIGPLIKIFWCAVTPTVTFITTVLCFYTYNEITYDRTYKYPAWAVSLGWCLAATSVIMIPIIAVIKITTARGSILERLRFLIKPQINSDQLAMKPEAYENN